MATRIKEVLGRYCSDQIGFMKGRAVGVGIRIIDDVVFHTSHNNMPGYLIAIDFEKAFDT